MSVFEKLLAHREVKEDIVKEQLLLDHLFAVAHQSGEAGAQIELGSVCMLIGLLHDLGKYSEKFQRYIEGQIKDKVNHSSAGALVLAHIAHFVMKEYGIDTDNKKTKLCHLYLEMMQYVILAHHGLYDVMDTNADYRTELRMAFAKDAKYDFEGEGLRFFPFLNQQYEKQYGQTIEALFLKGFEEFQCMDEKIKQLARIGDSNQTIKSKRLQFYYGALVRLLLSLLKDADIYDSANCFRIIQDKIYTDEEKCVIWEGMCESIEALYEKFAVSANESELDLLRTELANEIYAFAKQHGMGAYQLAIPVGSGKTLAALRYALTILKEFQGERFFYCTAFLSVLEQNANEIKEVLGSENEVHLLEHHSNVVNENINGSSDESKVDRQEYDVSEYLKESWEAPGILTTIVQLSNTLFKDKSANLRRFSKLIHSVIIIDEIQSLPAKAIYNFNLMTNFLTHIMGCNILHCTATQPNLDNANVLRYPCIYGDSSQHGKLAEQNAVGGSDDAQKTDYSESCKSIIKEIKNMEVFDRVDYFSLLGEDLKQQLDEDALVQHIKGEMKSEMSTLVVLNTKKDVGSVFATLCKDSDVREEDWEIFYLTTNQCPIHRLANIKRIKTRLCAIRAGEDQRKLICVSTRLIEAGVNLDFDLVYRAIAGLDSIVQCGGRCNREKKKIGNGRLYLFAYRDENLSRLLELEEERGAALSVLRIHQNRLFAGKRIHMEEACALYFEKLYANYEEKNAGRELEFEIKYDRDQKDTILNLLTTNDQKRDAYHQKKGKYPEFILKQDFKTASQKFDLIKEDSSSVIVEYENKKLLEELYQAVDGEDYGRVKTCLKRLQPYTIEIRRVEDKDPRLRREFDGSILILDKECYDKDIGLITGDLQLLLC